jgi:hypothetical protein
MKLLAAVLIAAGALVGVGSFLVDQRDQITQLRHRVYCLEHPAGASSVAYRNGRILQPPHATGCTHR